MAPLKDLKDLVSGNALTLYAGALLGFYGSRVLHAFLVTPLVEAVFKVEEGVARTGLKDPANYKELVDIAWGGLGVALIPSVNMKLGWTTGAFLSLADHIIDRFPEVAAQIPGA